MNEEPEDRVDDLEERSKELDREIEETETGWEKTQQETPSTVEDDEPLDEENPIGGSAG